MKHLDPVAARRKRGRTAAARLLLMGASLLAAPRSAVWPGPAVASPGDASHRLDVDLDDRVDPVRPGAEIVYEIEIENFGEGLAPGVVVTEWLPPGTSFVVAHRQPDWAEVPAVVVDGGVQLALGDVPPCDGDAGGRCRDVWAVLRVEPWVAPGTWLRNRVSVASSDPVSFPANEASVVTHVGDLLLRSGGIRHGRPGRDSIQLDLEVARSGRRTPLDAATATLDASAGVHLRIAADGGPVLLDVAVPAGALQRRASGYRLPRAAAATLAPLSKLDIRLPPELAQRNNARVIVGVTKAALPALAAGPYRIELEANGTTWSAAAPFDEAGSGRLVHRSTPPPS